MKKHIAILICCAVVVLLGSSAFAEEKNDIVKKHQERIVKMMQNMRSQGSAPIAKPITGVMTVVDIPVEKKMPRDPFFILMDANHDGLISVAEGLNAQNTAGRMAVGLIPYDSRYDTNRDKKVTIADVTFFGIMANACWTDQEKQLAAKIRPIFGVIDVNNDGLISVAEGLNAFYAAGRFAVGLIPYDSKYDTNGDGIASVADWTFFGFVANTFWTDQEKQLANRIRPVFSLMDTNHDCLISVAEGLNAYYTAGRMAAGLIPYDPKYDTNADGKMTVADWTFFGVVSNMFWTDQEKQLAGRIMPVFTIMDTNNDGLISAAEGLIAYNTAGRMAAGLIPYDSKYDTNGDGKMTASDYALFGLAANTFWTDQEKQLAARIRPVFSIMDTNNDGLISADEGLVAYNAAGNMAAGLTPYDPKYDTNGDGKMTVSDWVFFGIVANTFSVDKESGIGGINQPPPPVDLTQRVSGAPTNDNAFNLPVAPVGNPVVATPSPATVSMSNEEPEVIQRKALEAQIELKGNGKNYVISSQMADAPKEVVPIQEKQ